MSGARLHISCRWSALDLAQLGLHGRAVAMHTTARGILLLRLGAAMVIPIGASVVQRILWPWIDPLVWFLFYPAAFFSAILTGPVGGIVSAVFSAVLVWQYFLPAPHTEIHIFSVLGFAASGVLFSVVSARIQALKAMGRSQDTLLRTQAQLGHFIEHAPISIAMFDRQMNYLAHSGRWTKDYGRGHSDLIGLNHYMIHPDLPETWKDVHRRALRGETITNDGDMWTQADGSRHWLKWAVLPWTDESGAIGGIIMSAEDITERKRAEEALRVAAVAFQSHDGIMVTDAHASILQVNRAFADITGYDPTEVVGQTPALLSSGRHDAAFFRTMWEAITNEGHWEGQVWNRRKDGGVYPEWLSISAVRDDAGAIVNYVGVFSDVSEPKEAERRVLELAFYDALTGLPNRRLLADRLDQALAACRRNHRFGAILLLDLDNFKVLNDTRGHDYGDALLVEVARRLRGGLREEDSAARLGGDEFVVLLTDLSDDHRGAALAAEAVAAKLAAIIAEGVPINGEPHHVTVSIGATLFPHGDEGEYALLKEADIALYAAKNAGRNTIRFYDKGMQDAINLQATLEAGLRRALAEGHLEVYYQPQVAGDGSLIGAEALLRWQPPGMPMVSPNEFIPVAEATGLIQPIGRWLLETVCRQMKAWAGEFSDRPFVVAMNISVSQFMQPAFADQVRSALQSTGADPFRLKLEITESLVIRDVEHVISTMESLRRLGVQFSIDDFGTGYSSLSYLKRLPIDELKIAQNFVRGIVDSPDDRAIVRAILSLGRSLGIEVIAEGVENEAQRKLLAAEGCSHYQGYLFGRPAPASQLSPQTWAAHIGG